VHGFVAEGPGGDWSFGGSILTFAFPMILFIVVAGALYVLYTKPELVPGHRAPTLERPVSYTAIPGQPAPPTAAQTAAATPATATATAETPAATTETPAATAETPAAETTPGQAPQTQVAETQAAETQAAETEDTE
jgi:hypothetical protein